MHQHTTALGTIVQLVLIVWIFCFAVSILIKQHSQYLEWTKHTVTELFKTQWKLILGILIGWLLSTPGIIDISFQ